MADEQMVNALIDAQRDLTREMEAPRISVARREELCNLRDDARAAIVAALDRLRPC